MCVCHTELSIHFLCMLHSVHGSQGNQEQKHMHGKRNRCVGCMYIGTNEEFATEALCMISSGLGAG